MAYYSRKFSEPEERYDMHDKELLAIVDALEHWRVYAESCSDLTIFTDHKNLTYFTTTKKLNRRQVRWSELLREYKFKIIYTPGKDNGRADALSQRHDLMGKPTEVNAPILQANQDSSLGPAKHLCRISKVTIELNEEFHKAIIKDHHNDLLHGHNRVSRTIDLIQRNYRITNLRRKVEDYIKKYVPYQQNKHSTHAPYRESQPIPIPTKP